MKRKCGALILAAGKGTRMKSDRAKVIFKLAEKEMVRRVTERALQLDCDPIGIVVGYQKDEVIAAIPHNDKVSFIEQIEQQGTGHAVMVTAELFQDFEGDMFILCGDIPLLSKETLMNLLKTHQDNNAACTVLTIKLPDPAAYGRIVRNSEDQIIKIVEYKDATETERKINEINTGIYCFDCRLLFQALKEINNDNKQSEYYLTDTLEVLNRRQKKVIGLVTDKQSEITGINSQKELAELETEFYRRIKNHWLNNGVSIENPESVIIGEDVIIEPDVEIDIGTVIKGKSIIKKRTKIGAYCYLENVLLGSDIVLEGYNILKNTQISENELLSFQEIRIND
ncbi:MAG: NTP transferase domain-containing protein [Candidatus Cloacimonetes bacterium]|nr:NTP transferase domain-containing protein [Candidatus Cloacimonadota bacterium]